MSSDRKWEVKVHTLPNFRYDNTMLLDNKLLICDKKTLRYGLCDGYGNIVAPCFYFSIDEYKFGRAIAYTEYNCCILDELGYEVVASDYVLIKPGNVNGTYLAVIDRGVLRWGVLDIDGNVLVPFEYGDYRDIPEYSAPYVLLPKNSIYDFRIRHKITHEEVMIDGKVAFLKELKSDVGVLAAPLYIFRFYNEDEDNWDAYRLFDSDFDAGFAWGVCDGDGNVLVQPEYLPCFAANGDGPIGFTATKRSEDTLYFIEFIPRCITTQPLYRRQDDEGSVST